jgi:mono/diheme cytochrome c family protein
MRRAALALVALSLVACATGSGAPPDGALDGGVHPDANLTRDGSVPTSGETPEQLYRRLCASCHGEAGEGGIGPTLIDLPQSEDILYAQIHGRMPQGAPERCDEPCGHTLAHYIKTTFTSAALACDSVGPGPRQLRLLTRREYRATVRDLLGLPTDAPPTASCNHRTFDFDPAGRSLTSVSLAGSFNGWSASAWPMTWDAARARWTTARDLGDGDYQYKFVLNGTEWVQDPANPMTAPDGFGGNNSLLHVACGGTGPTSVLDPAASIPVESRADGFLFDDDAASGIVTDVHVTEYLKAARVSVQAVANMQALVGCDLGADRRGCTESFVRTMGRRVLRRPLDDLEVGRYRDLALAQSDALEGTRVALRALLVSPNFLYRSEMGELQADGSYQLTPWEIATAISYQLWGTTPDDTLLDAAASGALATPAGLEAQARRLLADPRARTQVGAFGAMWLGVDGVDALSKNAAMFPGWSNDLSASMVREAEELTAHVVFDGSHTLGELFTSSTTVVDGTLASYYGISGVSGASFVTAPMPSQRSGVLALGAVMARYAHSDQGSPIQRGLFVRRNLLCQSFPLPPANAGGVPDVSATATTRERFAMHTARAECAACHQYIDPIGFGFEGFDAIGSYRTMESGLPIDTSGDVNDVEGLGTGTHASFSTMSELGTILAGSSAAEQCFVRQYYRFARGYHEMLADRCAVRALQQSFHAGGDIRELMVSVILSPDFARRADRSAP